MVYCVDVPVWMFFQHLVDADAEGLIIKAFWNKVLVDAELCSSHRFTLRNLGQVKSEFSVMAPHRQKLLIMFNCIKQTVKEMRPFYISASKQCQNVQWKVSLTFTPLTQMSNVKNSNVNSNLHLHYCRLQASQAAPFWFFMHKHRAHF